jgi:hypothetical protein
MKTIGPVLDIDTAIYLTNFNDTDTFVIYELVTNNGSLVSQIIMQVWEVGSGHSDEVQCIDGSPVPLRAGVCHTFQWRLEEDEEDFLDHEGALYPGELIHNFPDELIDEVTHAVHSWISNDYVAMNPEVQ